MNRAEQCLSKDELRDYALGRLPETQSESVASHLETCVACEDTISSLDGTADSLVDFLQVPPSQRKIASAEYRAAMDNMKEVRPAINASESAQEATNVVSADGADEVVRDYKLISMLGAGGMGTVYKAIHTRLDRVVALKLLPARRIGNAEAIARFEREMKAIGKLDHPAIVRATDAGEENDQHFLAMEFVDGYDVSQLIERHGPLSVADACEIIRQSAIGLQHVHEQGLVHRDIKPSNLMVTADGQVKILDLGLALLGEQQDGMDELTTVGQMMGTVDYMAPEQCDDCHDVDIRADVYSLGATLFKMLTGSAPFATTTRRSPLSRIRALATEDAPRLSERLNDVPAALDETLKAMLARDPAARLQTPDDVAKAMTEFALGNDLPRAMATAAESPLPTPSAVLTPPAPGAIRPSLQAEPPSKPPVRRLTVGGAGKYILGAIAIVCAAIVFRLQTDKGEIVVECNVPNVEIKLLKDGALHQEMSLKQGKTSLSVFSGRYEIQIPGESDSVEVTADRFTISRGSRVIAEVKKVETPSDTIKSPATEDALDEPTYEGKTYADWKRQLFDRSHQQMSSAMKAVGILGVDSRADEAARSIFSAVKHLFRHSSTLGQSAFGADTDAEVRLTAVKAIRTLLSDPETIEVMRELLTKDDTAGRRFATSVLKRTTRPQIGKDEAAEEAVKHLISELLIASHDEDPEIRMNALYPLYDHAGTNTKIIDRYVELLATDDYGELEELAQTLYAIAPEKHSLIGQRYIQLYQEHQSAFEDLRAKGQSRATIGGWSLDWMKILHIAVECGGDAAITEPELIEIVKDVNAWPSSRAQAAYLLGQYSNNKKEVATALVDVLQAKESALKKECHLELYEFAQRPNTSKQRSKVALQLVLIESLGKQEERSDEAVAYLNDIVSLNAFGSGNFTLGTREMEVIKAAIEALEKIGMNGHSVIALEKLQTGPSPVQPAARAALQQIPNAERDRLREEAANEDGSEEGASDSGVRRT